MEPGPLHLQAARCRARKTLYAGPTLYDRHPCVTLIRQANRHLLRLAIATSPLFPALAFGFAAGRPAGGLTAQAFTTASISVGVPHTPSFLISTPLHPCTITTAAQR